MPASLIGKRILIAAGAFVLALITVYAVLTVRHEARVRSVLASYEAVPKDEVTGIIRGGEPYFLPGGGYDRAVLFIHGLSATPYDLWPLAEYLSGQGIAVYAPLLTGHGTTVWEFGKTGWRDWAGQPEAMFAELKTRYKKVYIVGFSMGGDIAIHIAANDAPAGVVLLAPCVFIKGQDKPVSPEQSIKYLSRLLVTDYILKDTENQAFDEAAVKGRPVYPVFPVGCLRSLVELEETARAELPKVKAPLIVVQSTNDATVDKAGPPYIIAHAGSADKKAVWVARSGHLLALDFEKESVFRSVYEFISNH